MTPKARAMAIIREVANAHLVDMAMVLAPCRIKRVTRARAAAAVRLEAELSYGPCKIGRLLNKNHTTIRFYLGRCKLRLGKLTWQKPVVRHISWIRSNKARKRHLGSLYASE